MRIKHLREDEKGSGLVFRKGKILRSVPEDQLIDALMEEIRAYEERE